MVPGPEWWPEGERAKLALMQAENWLADLPVNERTEFGTSLSLIWSDVRALRKHLEAVMSAGFRDEPMPPHPALAAEE